MLSERNLITKNEMVKCVKISNVGLSEGSLSLETLNNPTRRSGMTNHLRAEFRNGISRKLVKLKNLALYAAFDTKAAIYLESTLQTNNLEWEFE
jgi:hypothetical protein